jgi:carotenoid cleavage dioxygenase-like enzyme
MMRIKRREFLHLGAAAWLIGCDSSATKPADEPTPAEPCDADWWLCGNYAPVQESEAFDLEVVGTIPDSLSGLFVRNGPNPISGESAHWFMGDGMVHGVQLSSGKAEWYRARYVQTDILGVEQSGIGPPGPTTHQANTSVVEHGGRLLCLNEVGLPYEVSRTDLSTLGPHDFAGNLGGAMTAHPKIDPQTGEMLFFGYNLLANNVTFHAVDASGQLTRSEVIDVPAPVMMHDFQVTATHVVFLFLPVVFDLQLAVDGDGFPFRWDPSVGAMIGVMPRDGGNDDVEWFDIEPCYVFHTFNAFDDPSDPNKVILDAMRYPEMWVTSSTSFDSSGAPWRWEMTAGQGVVGGPYDDRGSELPRIDPRRQGLPYRYSYSAAAYGEAAGAVDGGVDKIIKYDREQDNATEHETSLRIGECVFVPASASGAEDDGYLLTYGYESSRDASVLMILDASNMAAEPLAKVILPTRVPYGFHGVWAPG